MTVGIFWAMGGPAVSFQSCLLESYLSGHLSGERGVARTLMAALEDPPTHTTISLPLTVPLPALSPQSYSQAS